MKGVIAEYIRDCEVGLAAATVAAYAWGLGHLVLYLPRRELVTVTHIDLRLFFAWLVRRGYSDSSRHQHYRTLRSFFGWAVRQGYLADNPVLLVRSPGLPEPARSGIALEDVSKLLVAAAGGRCPKRDRAIVLLLLDTGLRRRELVGLCQADLDVSGMMLTVRLGKGRRGRVVPVSPRVVKLLVGWLAVRGDLGSRIFGLTNSGVNLLFRRLSARSGVHCSPHTLRHTFATHYGGDIEDLRLILGHANVATTATIYRHRQVRRLIAGHGKLSPVARVL